jgi:hypothetical protein
VLPVERLKGERLKGAKKMQINEQNPAVYQAAPARLLAQKVLAQWLLSC